MFLAKLAATPAAASAAPPVVLSQRRTSRRLRFGGLAAVGIMLVVAGCSSSTSESATASGSPSVAASSPTGNADPATQAALSAAMSTLMSKYQLKSLIVRITKDGQDVFTTASGEAMTGVPATPEMRFRNGSFAFTYIGEIFAKLVDQGKVSLDDPLATWFPEYPRASEITVKNLLNMTSGYADYVYQPAMGDSLNADPFKQWTNEELLALGFGGPEQFAPGTNWGYSHTNYVILTQVLSKITGKPMAEVMDEYIIKPMNLTATGGNDDTPAIPEPAMHAFTSERAEYFGVSPISRLYEESTYWNPSWTTGEGAVQTSNIYDVTTSMEIVGSGSQVSDEMYAAQTGPNLVGFGSKDPTGVCTACRPNTEAASYGLGVILLGPWITQTKSFAGAAATSGYLPSEQLTVSVAMTYLPTAYDAATDLNASSWATFSGLADVVAPGQAPPPPSTG